MQKRIVLPLVAALVAFGALFASCTSPVSEGPAPESSLFADLDAGIAFWLERTTTDPADFVAFNKLGNLYYQRARLTSDIADYERAGAAYQSAVDVHPATFVDGLLGLGFVATARHEFESAIDLAEQVLAADPGEEAALAIRGDALVALGEYEAAMSDYETLADRTPGLASHARIAILLAMLGNPESAAASWAAALADTNAGTADRAWALAEHGNFQFAIGRLAEARASHAAALELVTGYLPAELGLADVRAAKGDLERAILTYEDAVRRAPSPETALKLGDLLVAAGREDEATEQYELVEAFAALFEASGIRTELPVIHYYADHGRPNDAVAMARELYEARPGIYSADALAWALHQSGKPAEAAVYAKEALRFDTPDGALYFRAGVILDAAGDPARAEIALARALELNPAFSPLHAAEAQALLAELARVEAAR